MDSISRIQNFEYTLNEVFKFNSHVVKSDNPQFNRFQHIVAIDNNRPSLSSYDFGKIADAALTDNCSTMYVGTEQISRNHATTFRHLFEVSPRFLPLSDEDNTTVWRWCNDCEYVELTPDQNAHGHLRNVLTIHDKYTFTLVMRSIGDSFKRYQLRELDTYNTLATFDCASELLAWIECEFDIPVTTAANR